MWKKTPWSSAHLPERSERRKNVNNTQITLLIVFLILDLIVTITRAGLLNARYARLISMQENKNKRTEKTIELVTNRVKTRSTLKLTQSILRSLMAGLVLSFFFFDLSYTTMLLILVVTAIFIWLSEFAVERGVLRNPEVWAVRLTPLANFFIIFLSPVLALPLRLAKRNEGTNLVTITEDELITLVDASQRAGEIEKDESEMIHSVFQFGDRIAREIMVPRVDMLTLNVNTPLEEAADALLESGYSRVPIYEGRKDNVIGFLYTKDMLKVWREGNGIDSLHELLRPAKFVPETKKVDELLDEMQAARVHIAIVVDEYGGVAGLVTLEDIIEEVFGEIQDEYDIGEEEPYRKVGPGEYLFNGRFLLDEINEIMGTQLPTDNADTLGGLIFNSIGRVPKKGETLTEANVLLTVEQLNERRIHKVRAKLEPSTDPPPIEEEHQAKK
jgi:CBS domain containing-hemolysin-like protein